jgi:hypothetical protein
MIDKISRHFTCLVSHLHPVPSNNGGSSATWTMTEVADELLAYERPFGQNVNPRSVIELMDGRIESNVLVLLFGYADKGAADPAFRDLKKRTNRVAVKGPDEGLAYAAHIAIDLERSDNGGHSALLEQVPRVNRTVICRLLNDVLRQDTDLVRTLQTDKELYPRLEFSGKTGALLKEALTHGNVHGIEFVRDQSEAEGAVGEAALEPVSMTAKFALKRKRPANLDLYGMITSLIGKARDQDYDTLRLVFTDGNVDKRSTVEIPTDEEKDITFLKRIRMAFDAKLESAPTTIVDAVATRMVTYLRTGDVGQESSSADN